jgi:hypothetical protein
MEKSIRSPIYLGLSRTPNSTMTHMTKNSWQSMRHSRLGDTTLKALKFRLMLSQTTKTWNIFVLHGFCPGDKLGGLLSCPDLIWLLDPVPAALEQSPMHLLVDLTSTQKGRENLMIPSIHKIVILFFLLISCPLLSEPLRCFR